MNPYAIPLLVSFILLFSLGMFVFVKNRRSIVNITYALLSLSTSIWLLSYAMMYLSRKIEIALWWAKSGYIGVIFLPITFYHFIVSFLEKKREKKIIPLLYLLGILFAASVYLTKNFIKDLYKYFWGFYPKTGFLQPIFLGIYGSIFILCLTYLFASYRLRREISPLKRNQIKYMFLAFFVAFFGIVDFLPNYGIKIYPFGFACAVATVSIIAYSIIQYRLMEIEVIIRRALVFTGIYAPIFALFFLITFYGQEGVRETFGLLGININRWVLVALGAAFIAVIIRPLNNFLVRTTDRFLYQKKYDYHKVLQDASRGMARIVDLKHLLGLIVHFISMRVRVHHTAILLRDRESEDYLVRSSRGYEGKLKPHRLNGDSPLIKYLFDKKEPIVRGEIEYFLKSKSTPRTERYSFETLAQIKDEMARIGASVVIPSLLGHELIGILIIGDKKSLDMYTQEDLNMLQTVASEAAIAISNARAYEDLRNTQAQLLHEEKLATIGRMANAIGHEINNPLSILFMNLQTLERDLRENKKLSPDVVSERLEKANQQTQRINVVVHELTHLFRETERGVRGALDLRDIIKESLGLARYQSGLGESLDYIEIIQEIPDDLPKIKGNLNQLQQVFLNLFTNACHAMGTKGRIIISAQVSSENLGFIKIEFKDTGPGIPKELLNKIFDYRFTTRKKGKGVGLGLFVSRYILTLHGGSIAAESELGKGTTFILQLPIWKGEA